MLQPIDLSNRLALLKQMGGEPLTEAAGSFDHPAGPRRVTGPLRGPSKHLAVTEGVGEEGLILDDVAPKCSGRTAGRDGASNDAEEGSDDPTL